MDSNTGNNMADNWGNSILRLRVRSGMLQLPKAFVHNIPCLDKFHCRTPRAHKKIHLVSSNFLPWDTPHVVCNMLRLDF